MDRKRIALFLGIPALGGVLLAGALLLRDAAAPGAPSKPQPVKPVGAIYTPARTESAPPPASPEKIALATDQVRIRGTYQNFRRAVATDDADLQKVLLPVLLKDRAEARKCADEDLARAKSDLDRSIAHKVIEALRR